MKRASYLQHIVPHAPAPTRDGIAVLTPPRLLFRPYVATDLLGITPTTPVRRAAPAIDAPVPRPVSASGEVSGASATTLAPVDRQRRPAASGSTAHATASEPAQGMPRPSRAAPLVAEDRVRPPPASSEIALQAATLDGSKSAIRQHSTAQGAPSVVRAALPQLRSAAPAPDGVVVPPAAKPPIRPLASPLTPAKASALEAVTPPSTRPSFPSTAAPANQVAEAAVPRAPQRPVITDPAPASLARTPPRSAAPAETIAPPPMNALARPPRARPAPSLHIGTLEVRVVAPQPPLPSAATVLPRAATRHAGRAAAPAQGRIARGFGVFGLGQS